MRAIKRIILFTLTTLLIISIIFGLGFYFGRTYAFEDIISEKCSLNNSSRDIECIAYIGG